jgi:uncharacterized metal-binding protein YceD (DUF177 family)
MRLVYASNALWDDFLTAIARGAVADCASLKAGVVMQIWVARIPEEGSHYEGEDPGAIMGLDGEQFVKVAGDVRYSLYAQHVSDELVVSGTLEVDLELMCSRCADFFSTTVVDSDFLRAYPASEDIDSVDITEDMREDLLLCVPAFPVCSEGCKGLCAQCGADLSKGSCKCEKGGRPNPWSTLDNLDL